MVAFGDIQANPNFGAFSHGPGIKEYVHPRVKLGIHPLNNSCNNDLHTSSLNHRDLQKLRILRHSNVMKPILLLAVILIDISAIVIRVLTGKWSTFAKLSLLCSHLTLLNEAIQNTMTQLEL